MKYTKVFGINSLTYDTNEIETMEEMGHAFGDGTEEGKFCCDKTIEKFIGRAFHLNQQSTGALYLNDVRLYAYTIKDTDGDSISKSSIVLVRIEDLLMDKLKYGYSANILSRRGK